MKNTEQFRIYLKQKMIFHIDRESISIPGVLQKWIKSYDLYNYLKRELAEYRVRGEDEEASLLQYVLMAASNQTISEVKYHESKIDCDDAKLHFWTTCKVDSPPNGCPRDSFYIKLGDYGALLNLFCKKFILSDGVLFVHKVGDGDIFIRLYGEISFIGLNQYKYQSMYQAIMEDMLKKEELKMLYTGRIMNHPPKYHNPFSIKDIKFNGPATIVFWEDGEKTVVKMDKSEKKFDVEKAVMAAYTKRALSTLSNARERSIDLTLDMAREKYDAYLKEIKPKEVKIKK